MTWQKYEVIVYFEDVRFDKFTIRARTEKEARRIAKNKYKKAYRKYAHVEELRRIYIA